MVYKISLVSVERSGKLLSSSGVEDRFLCTKDVPGLTQERQDTAGSGGLQECALWRNTCLLV